MSKLSVQQIRDEAIRIIGATAGGIRYAALVNSIHTPNPETPVNTIHGAIWNLHTVYPHQITKPSRGLFKSISDSSQRLESKALVSKLSEADFYESFADFLKTDLDEASDAVAIGGSSLRGKWGTPDVVGTYKPSASNLVRFPIEIISAELKIDPSQSVVAFGQATAYRLFSTKAYIVMPTTISAEDLSRLEALCLLFGVGLVLFELSIDDPNFQIRVRAQRFSPDMFYVNEFADRLRETNNSHFETLFA